MPAITKYAIKNAHPKSITVQNIQAASSMAAHNGTKTIFKGSILNMHAKYNDPTLMGNKASTVDSSISSPTSKFASPKSTQNSTKVSFVEQIKGQIKLLGNLASASIKKNNIAILPSHRKADSEIRIAPKHKIALNSNDVK
jgi:hypothetical protein